MRATRRFLRFGGWRPGILRCLPVLLVLALWVGTAWVGCDVHEFPEQKVPGRPDNPDDPDSPDDPVWPDHPDDPDDPDDPEPGPVDPTVPRTPIALRLEYAPLFYLWEHSYDPLLAQVEETSPSLDLFPGYPGTSACYDGTLSAGRLQVTARAYSVGTASVRVADTTFVCDLDGSGYDMDFVLPLPSDAVSDVFVWSQLLAPGQEAPFYDASNFSRIRIVADAYAGNTDYRDAFSGSLRVDAAAAAEADGLCTVSMTRPMGKFELITTDLSEFLDRETATRQLSRRAAPEDYRIVITFPRYYPNSYSARDDRLENATTGVSFETVMTVTGESEASLGFEYVLLNDIPDGGVQTNVDVYRLDGTHVAGSAMFTVPMRRDHHTLLRGAFLTTEGGGGVGIDPSFNGDFNVTW